MSVLFWVFAAKSGVDAYDIDSLQGTYDSLEVPHRTVGTHIFLPSETDNPSLLGAGCIFVGVHTSIAIIVCQDIRLAFL